jgi:hypothetical protein
VVSVFSVRPHTQRYRRGAFRLDGVTDCNSMVRAESTRKRVRQFSISSGRFEGRNTLLPGVALYVWCVYKWCFLNGEVLIEMKMMGVLPRPYIHDRGAFPTHTLIALFQLIS